MQSVTIPFEFDHRRRHRPAFRDLKELVRYVGAASELMAIRALAEDPADLLKRVRQPLTHFGQDCDEDHYPPRGQ